jgi:hypothetical protein
MIAKLRASCLLPNPRTKRIRYNPQKRSQVIIILTTAWRELGCRIPAAQVSAMRDF